MRASKSTILAAGLAVIVGALSRCADPVADPPTSLDRFQDRVKPGSLFGWNLLLITLDTVRSDRLGCYGYGPAETPAIDRLAARGAQFDQAVTDVPATLPAHCSIMTGLGAPRHGVRTNGHFSLDEGIDTLADVMSDAGYATTAFVNTFVLNSRFGLAQGFDNYDEHPVPGVSSGLRRADVVTDRAIAWLADHLGANPGQPYFAWVHYFDPHAPYDPPGEFGIRFADAPYDGEIAFTDFHLRRLLDFLDERGQTQRTLIVLTADHGEGLGEHLEPEHSRLIYDTTVHVPLIISCPQLYEASCRIDDIVVGNIDIMPTVLSVLGIEFELDVDGLDLASASVSSDRALYIETLAPLLYHGWASLHGLRRIDAKYIDAPTSEYYDLAADPGEMNNLLYADPDADGGLADQLVARMSQWQSADASLAAANPLTDKAARMLGALGYVSTREHGAPVSVRRPDPKDIHPLFGDLRNKTPGELHEMALAMATAGDRDRGTYRRALILARAAQEREQDNPAFLATVGIAQYRVGEHEAALWALDRSEQMLVSTGSPPSARTMAFRAMTLSRLGQAGAARAELGRFRAALAAESEQIELTELLAEVQATVDDK